MIHQGGKHGLDGWVFLGDMHQSEVDQALGRYPIRPDLVAETARTLSLMDRACRRRGAQFWPILVPSKPSIYLDKVPVAAADKRPALSPMSQIMAAARDHGLDLIDLRPQLTAARRQAETFSRLNSHWTEFGGWIGWQAIAARLRQANPHLRLLDVPARGVVEVDAYNEMRDLAGVEGVNNWTRPLFDYDFPDFFIVQPNGASSRQGGLRAIDFTEMPVDVHSPNALNDAVCLMLGDSTVSALSPLLHLHFAQVAYRHHHAQGERCCELADLVARTGATVVFYLITERYAILPLHEPDHWMALEAFETAPAAAPHHAWPLRASAVPLTCTNGPRLDAPNLVQLPDHAPDGRFAVAVTVASEGEGLVMSAAHVAGVPRQRWHKVGPGLNHLYLTLPSRTDGRHLWLVRDMGRPPVFLEAVSVRCIA